MIIELLIMLLLGIIAGVACGLLPGLHVNNVGLISLGLMPHLGISPPLFTVFLVSMSTVQTFIDFIPSTFLGVPDEDTVLSLLPAHKLLIEGRGQEVIKITASASLYGVLVSILLLPLAYFLVVFSYESIRTIIIPILIISLSYLVMRERTHEKILWAIATIFISGYLGYTCLNMRSMSSSEIFLPMFSGLFGLSTLAMGIKTNDIKYPQEKEIKLKVGKQFIIKNSVVGAIGGLIVGILPAMSPSQIGILLQELGTIKKRTKEKIEDVNVRGFISVVSSLNTADAIFSIFSLYLIGNPRSGISVIIQDLFGSLDFAMLILLCTVMLISGVLAYFIHIELGRLFSEFSEKISLKILSAIGFIFVFSMVFATTGLIGLLIAVVSMAIGIIPPLTGISRTHCMGCLLVPTLIFFMGV